MGNINVGPYNFVDVVAVVLIVILVLSLCVYELLIKDPRKSKRSTAKFTITVGCIVVMMYLTVASLFNTQKQLVQGMSAVEMESSVEEYTKQTTEQYKIVWYKFTEEGVMITYIIGEGYDSKEIPIENVVFDQNDNSHVKFKVYSSKDESLPKVYVVDKVHLVDAI